MLIRTNHLAGVLSLTLTLAGCASNPAHVQHEVDNKSVRGVCAADFATDDQGRRSAEVIRQPGVDSGFISGAFPAEIKVWVTAAGSGTRLVTLHATPRDTAITIPVERITALALQSCEALDDGSQAATAPILTTAN
jgi:hypothetical protein